LVQQFFKKIHAASTFICSSCGGLFYEESTTKTSKELLLKRGCDETLVVNVLCVNQQQHLLCGTCKLAVYRKKVPRLCLSNGFEFPIVPVILKVSTNLNMCVHLL